MRMCVRSHRPPEKPISRCFPRASTASTDAPTSTDRSGTRDSPGPGCATARRTTPPTSARRSTVAVRKMVSPSGIDRSYRPGRRGQSVYCGRPGRPAAGTVRAHEDRHRPRHRQHPCLRQGQGRGAQRAERGGDQRRRQPPGGGGGRGPRDDRAHPGQRAGHPADARRRDRRLPDHRGHAALRDQQGDARHPPLQAGGDDLRPLRRDQRREARGP